MTKAWVERGLSLPCSEFFLSVLDTYGLQPHNICPNSYLLLSNFATLCEGHLGSRPSVTLWQFFFRVKKETKDKAMLNCGSMTFMLRSGRMYPPHDSHESVWYWNAGWFYVKNASVPNVHDGLPAFNNKPPEELASWSFIPSLAQTPILEKAARRISCSILWRRRMRNILRVPVSGESAEEDPEDPEEEEERAPRKAALDLQSESEFNHRADQRSRAHYKVYASEIPCRWSLDTSSAKRSPSYPTAISSSRGSISCSCCIHSTGNNSGEKWELEQDLLNAMLNNAWGKPDVETSEIQEFKKDVGKFFDKLVCKQKEQKALHYELHKNIALQRRVTINQAEKIQSFQTENADLKKQLSEAQVGASSSLAAASSELETLRASQKDLEAKLAEAEKKLAEKNSELIQKEGEFQLKRKTDSDTIKKQQKELGGLRKYMDTAEASWDWLISGVLDPLGHDEERRSQFPRDDLIQLAGDDCKDLISAARKICHNLNIKKSRSCDVCELITRMDILPELVVDLQASSARGAAAMSLAMCLAHNPDLDVDRVTTGVPSDADVNALLNAVSGYDTRIARRIRHDEFYDKVVLPADEPLEAELHKEREAESKPAQSGSQYTWTSSKDQSGAASPATNEEENDDDVSSPGKGEETDAPATDVDAEISPAKEQ
ncbi:hypothetical protein QYE76_039797 [Lolium multiflorum]|uniref:Transposase (putative) gypsy type domain-containing protein n=1 Tax=Lolium multiflorum TaxID=4521 RepID=A0AAD8WSJ8_LOLMU|nr:hypothetical protein QYE76_039797 [Lolium multiflorum]